MKLKDFMIIMVVISLLALCVAGFIGGLNSEYNSTPTNISLIDAYAAKLNNSKTMTTNLYNAAGSGGITAGGITGALFSNIGSIFQLILSSVTVPIELITLTASNFGIPPLITLSVITILILVIVFAIISAILGRTP
jgi:hypothetical protein